MKVKNVDIESLQESLDKLLKIAHERNEVDFRTVFNTLAGRGYAILLILFSLPFAIPFSIPGLSTPFGIALAYLGLRLALAKRLWWPKWILNKTITGPHLATLIKNVSKVTVRLQKFVHPRILILTTHQFLHSLSGIIVFLLALFLLLPLPIPFSNTIAALPILFIGLGLLENDGFFILIGYIIAAIALVMITLIFVFGYKLFFKM